VGRVYECAGDFIPTKFLLIFAIGIGVTAPIIGKVSAICLALLFGEKFNIFR
jgi:hypothetical protein